MAQGLLKIQAVKSVTKGNSLLVVFPFFFRTPTCSRASTPCSAATCQQAATAAARSARPSPRRSATWSHPTHSARDTTDKQFSPLMDRNTSGKSIHADKNRCVCQQQKKTVIRPPNIFFAPATTVSDSPQDFQRKRKSFQNIKLSL